MCLEIIQHDEVQEYVALGILDGYNNLLFRELFLLLFSALFSLLFIVILIVV